ncbi:uncharacterized protein LOC126397711 [Epinephelus moara]|uniref:uncharacterized protein LOC126397711 n=1 Tax=Epinephelus moara TaxID=300413 RepID=UPI00214F3353|nr:uncharacterized protein LOC126397711 [Epinephelus moara]
MLFFVINTFLLLKIFKICCVPELTVPPVTLMQKSLNTPPDSSSSHMTQEVAYIFGGKIKYKKQTLEMPLTLWQLTYKVLMDRLVYMEIQQMWSIPSLTWLTQSHGYVLTPLDQLQRLPNWPSLMTLPTGTGLVLDQEHQLQPGLGWMSLDAKANPAGNQSREPQRSPLHLNSLYTTGTLSTQQDNEICDNTNYTEPRQAKAIQNASNSPKTTARPRARKNYANSTPEKPRARRSIANTTPDQPDTILIGDSITKHVRMAKTENLTVSDTSVRELTELLPVILSTHPSNMRIIIHAGSFDILRRKTGSEILKKDFSLLLEKLSDCQSQNVFISGPIPTLGKGIESFTRLLALNTWLTSACFTHGIKFIDNFNIFWNCKDRFQRDGIHPNITGCRLLGANLRHALGMPYQNKNGQIRAKDKYGAQRQTACISPPSPDPLLHITQGIQRMSLSQSGIQQPPSCPSPQPPRSQRRPPPSTGATTKEPTSTLPTTTTITTEPASTLPPSTTLTNQGVS